MNDIRIDTDKCIAVTGKSILSSSAKILSTDVSKCTYLEYRTFCDFLEAVILHEKVYVLGQFSERENQAADLMEKLNELNKSNFIFLLNDSDNKFFINRQDVDRQLKNIAINVFQNKISFIRKQLLPKSFTYRYNDDEKTSFINDITLSDQGQVEIIRDVIVNLFNTKTNSEFLKHLLRGFVIASVASILNGTAKLTGSRKPLSLLIKEKNKDYNFETDLFKIYQHVNNLYLLKQSDNTKQFFHPLLLTIFLKRIQSKTDSLILIIKLREEFKQIREAYLNIELNSKKEINKKSKRLQNTYKYFNEIYRFASNNNLKNLGRKYSKELLLDESSVEMKYEFEKNNDDTKDDSKVSAGINITKVAKNAIKFIVEFARNKIINKQNEPLTSYFVEQLNTKVPLIEDFIVIDEFHRNKMRIFDKLISKNKL